MQIKEIVHFYLGRSKCKKHDVRNSKINKNIMSKIVSTVKLRVYCCFGGYSLLSTHTCFSFSLSDKDILKTVTYGIISHINITQILCSLWILFQFRHFQF